MFLNKMDYKIVVAIIVIIFIYLWYRKNKPYPLIEDLSSTIPNFILSKGKDEFKSSKILICGLAKNIENNFNDFIGIIKIIVSLFNDHLILIVENDSTDNTDKLLKCMKNKYNVKILKGVLSDNNQNNRIIEKIFFGIGEKRIKRMIELRNIYIDFIFSNNLDSIYKYLIMVDTDLKTDISNPQKNISRKNITNGLLSCGYYLSKFPINMIGANSLNKNMKYYDSYALKLIGKNSLFNNCFFDYTSNISGDINDIIKVDSCFGGFAIYKTSSIKSKKYTIEKYVNNIVLCEHVPFNKSIGEIYVNPKFVIPILEH